MLFLGLFIPNCNQDDIKNSAFVAINPPLIGRPQGIAPTNKVSS
jgi:hypothetical protein